MRRAVYVLSVLLCLCIMYTLGYAEITQKLIIGPDKRFLVKENGEPFVWIGETNWFFAKLPPSTIDQILDKRSEQGFTIMFVSCRENLYNGQGGPGGITSPNEAWWSYLDDYIDKCNDMDMYVGINLGWYGVAKSNTATNLYAYGLRVGNRYKDKKNIVWLTLGEAGGHKRKTELPCENVEALVNGIRAGDTGDKLLTIHADYRRGTSLKACDANIVDFNNWQTSQWEAPGIDNNRVLPRNGTPIGGGRVWDVIAYDYAKLYNGQPKPTLDSEAKYENNKDFCGADAFVIRRRAYFTILAGGFGFTYGAGGIWDGLTVPEGCSGNALQALNYPGAEDIGLLSGFLHFLGNQFIKLRPDQNLIAAGQSNSYSYHIQASVAKDSSFALVYSASDNIYFMNLTKLAPDSLIAHWFNPGDGTTQVDSSIIYLNTSTSQSIDPPGNESAGHDWVLYMTGLHAEQDDDTALPQILDTYGLFPNYPNPFNGFTTIQYSLTSPSHVKVQIYNASGRIITTLLDSDQSAQVHTLQWNGQDKYNKRVDSGIYFSRVTSNQFTDVNKILLIR